MLSSAANVLPAIAVAKAGSAAAFGRFSLAVILSLLTLQVVRAIVLDPALVTSAVNHATAVTSPLPRRSAEASAAVSAAALVAAIIAVPLGLLLLGISDGGLRLSLLFVVMAVATSVQDSIRYVAFTRRRPNVAVVSDATWLILAVVGVATILKANIGPEYLGALFWAAGAAAGAVAGAAFLHLLPGPGVTQMLATQRGLRAGFLVDHLLGFGVANLALVAFAALRTTDDLGAVRAVFVLFGPLNTLGQALYFVAAPDLAVTATGSYRAALRHATMIGAVLAGAWLTYGGLLLLMPNRWGEAILGDSWAAANELLVPLLVGNCFGAFALAWYFLLKASRDVRAIVRVRAITTVAMLTLPLGLGAARGAPGFALGFAAATFVQFVAAGWHVTRPRSPRDGITNSVHDIARADS